MVTVQILNILSFCNWHSHVYSVYISSLFLLNCFYLFFCFSNLLSKNLTMMNNEAVRETRTTCKVTAHIFVTVFTMTMLLWAIYTGFRLATESSRDSKYYLLTITVGVVTIIFGLIYLIIGLAIFVELALDLFGRLP